MSFIIQPQLLKQLYPLLNSPIMVFECLIQLNRIKINCKYGKRMWVRANIAKANFLKQDI